MNLKLINEKLEKKLAKLNEFKEEKEEDMEGDIKKKAESYYQQKIMPLAIEKFTNTQRNKVSKDYDVYISTVGMSYEPIVYSVLTFEPEKVLFLVTEDTLGQLDTIMYFTKLKPSQWTRSLVNKNNFSEVYKNINDFYRGLSDDLDIAIDITGGTKAMTGGAAMASTFINADIYYVASTDYQEDLRQPSPGSEYLVEIDNPYNVFGDLELDKVKILWEKYNFGAAENILADVKNKISAAEKVKKIDILYNLTGAYKAWDEFNLTDAREKLEKALNQISQFGIYEDYMNSLQEQKNVVIRLEKNLKEEIDLSGLKNGELMKNIIFSLYTNALRQEELNKFDLAALLLYRIMEMIAQRRLALYDIDTAEPDLSEEKKDEFLEEMNQLAQETDALNEMQELPEKISNLKAYILLAVLNDPVVEVIDWNKFKGTLEARNNSIFAHGYKFIKEQTYYSFKEVVLKIMNNYCRVEEINKEDMIEKCKFKKVLK